MKNLICISALAFCSACGGSNPSGPTRLPVVVDTPAAVAVPAQEDSSVIARVDDRVLTRDELMILDPDRSLSLEEIQPLVENWVERQIMLKVAAEMNLPSDTIVRMSIEEERTRVLLSALGKRLRESTADDTAARALLHNKTEEMRRKSRVEMSPWRAR